MAPEAAAELRKELNKELLEGVVPVLLQSLADEGKLTREQVKTSAADLKAEIGALRGELDAKMDTVTFPFPSPPPVLFSPANTLATCTPFSLSFARAHLSSSP